MERQISSDASKSVEVKAKQIIEFDQLRSLKHKEVYAGTADSKVVAKRRAKNKAANRARRNNRKTA